ncbi:alcohol dehydrogenase catalytic domain-containing protein, partial [bacterium]|nr:alcohol dehydrogenase catalytic domain-containing protein [bacterium]
MRAILISEPKKFQIIERSIPTPQSNEILINVKAVSLCNQHDWKVNNGLYKELAYLEYGVPGFPGHEGAGVVVTTGAEVTALKPGDHVVMSGLG